MTRTQRELKVVHLDTGSALRGGQRQLLLLARELRERGHEQLIVCPEGSALEVRAGRESFPVLTLPRHDPAHLHGAFQLRQQIVARPVQIVHAHDGRSQNLAWLASVGLPVRRIATRRVTFLPNSLLGLRLRYTVTCHHVIAVSEFIRRLLLNAGVPRARIELVYDGIELPAAPPSPERRAALRAVWGFGPEDLLVGHVGAFTAEKGQDVAVQAVLRLRDQHPRLALLLAGGGPLLDSPSFRNLAEQAQGRVKLLGPIEDLSEFLFSLDLFVMPSMSEGLGSSALAALAHGLPVIASRVGGLPELVEEGVTGWLVPPGSPAPLAEALARAARDRDLLARLSANAREKAAMFLSDRMVERTESLYHRALAAASDLKFEL